MMIRSELPNLEDLSAAELRSLVVSLLAAVAQLEAKVAALTEENIRLKGRPNLKPSGLEKGTDPSPPPSGRAGHRQRRREPRPPKSARLIVDEDRVVPLAPQPGWRFKGFKFYTVQDLVVETRVVRYWRPCYQTPEGKLVIAPLPPEVTGHFAANLVRSLLSQHYQCRVTMPLLHQQLQDVGILISTGQISNLLTKGHEAFHTEKAAVKQAGLAGQSGEARIFLTQDNNLTAKVPLRRSILQCNLQQKYRLMGKHNPQRDDGPEKGLYRLHPIALVARRVDVVGQRQRLIDGLDAESLGVARAPDFHFLAIDQNVAGVGLIGAGKDLDQRRLAGAVMAEQSHHFAGEKIDSDAVDRLDAAELDGNVPHLHQRNGIRRIGC